MLPYRRFICESTSNFWSQRNVAAAPRRSQFPLQPGDETNEAHVEKGETQFNGNLSISCIVLICQLSGSVLYTTASYHNLPVLLHIKQCFQCYLGPLLCPQASRKNKARTTSIHYLKKVSLQNTKTERADRSSFSWRLRPSSWGNTHKSKAEK